MTALYTISAIIIILILAYRRLARKAKMNSCGPLCLFPGQKKSRFNKIKKDSPYSEQMKQIREMVEKAKKETKNVE